MAVRKCPRCYKDHDEFQFCKDQVTAAHLQEADLIRQGAEAASRAKMFMAGIGRPDLVDHYAVLDQRLTAMADEVDQLKAALRDAALSLNTIALMAGKDEYMANIQQIRGYANSRAAAAFSAIGEPQPVHPTTGPKNPPKIPNDRPFA